jgi:hypothetical protein
MHITVIKIMTALLLLICLNACNENKHEAVLQTQASPEMLKVWLNARDVVYEVNGSNVMTNLIPIHQAALHPEGRAWVIESSGTDPHVRTQPLDFSGPGSYWLSIRMTVPDSTVVIIYYGRKEAPFRYSDHDMSCFEAKKGQNQFVLDLKDPGTIGTLRFDPGDLPGKYVIEEFIIKRMP